MAKAQPTETDRVIAQEFVGGVMANELRAKKYSFVVDLKFHSYDLTWNPSQLEMEGELAVFVDHEKKYWYRTHQKEVINNKELALGAFRIELGKKGETFYRIPARKLDIPMKPSTSIALFEPFEIGVITIGRFEEGDCNSGLVLDLCDTEKLVHVDEIAGTKRGKLTRLVYQYLPTIRNYVTFSENQGNMPVYMEIRGLRDGLKSSSSDADFDYFLSNTSTEWEKLDDLWVPHRVRMSSIQSQNRLKVSNDAELTFQWCLDETMTPEQVESLPPEDLYEVIDEKTKAKLK